MMGPEEQQRGYIRRLEAHLNISVENKNYSQRRLDLLLITVSSFGIAFSLQALLYLKEHSIDGFNFILVFGIAVYVITILISFVSQIFGYLCNKYEEDWAHCEISRAEKAEEESEEQARYDELSNRYSKLVRVTNWVSYVTIVTAMISSVLFLFRVF